MGNNAATRKKVQAAPPPQDPKAKSLVSHGQSSLVRFECVRSVGTVEGQRPSIDAPRGVAVDLKTGKVFVSAGDEIVIFADSGLELRTAISFGSCGRDNGSFGRPAGLTIVSERRLLLVADYENSRIQVFSLADIESSSVKSPSHVATLALPSLRHPYCIAVDPRDQMLFVTTQESEIFSGITLEELVDPAKTLDASAWWRCETSQAFRGELDMIVHSRRRERFLLAYCYEHKVVALRRGPDTQLVGEQEYMDFPFITYPVGIAIDERHGLLFVSGGQNCHGVAVFNEDTGSVVSRFAGRFNLPACLALDACGSLLVCNRRANNVQVWAHRSQVGTLQEYCFQIIHQHRLLQLLEADGGEEVVAVVVEEADKGNNNNEKG